MSSLNSTLLKPAQAPDTRAFVEVKNHHILLRYFQNLQQHFMVANNFGLALNDDDRPASSTSPAYLRNLFVPPHLSETHYLPEQLIKLEQDNQTQSWLDVVVVMKQHPRLFLLGDPGAGKSTLLSWLMLAFSHSGDNLTKMQLGERVPFLLVLRDLPLSKIRDWDGLWQVFLNRHLDHLAAPLHEQAELVEKLFESGQALLLIDGLDEVTEAESRKHLGKAILQGINRYPRCGFLVTSRILGFDQLEWFGHKIKKILPAVSDSLQDLSETNIQLDELGANILLETLKRSTKTSINPSKIVLPITIDVRNTNFFELPVFYLSPFDLAQAHQFIENWYRQYQGHDHNLSKRIADLQDRIAQHDGLGRLARIPVLLNMICFIHARRGRLPDGRAELYQRIAETYLTGLDKARGVKFLGREFNYDYLDLSEWLGKLALNLQDKRGEDDQALLIEKTDIETLLHSELAERGMEVAQITEEIEFILRYLAERSGLFIPRGKNEQGTEQYGFTHLSFLEYFAAYAIKQEAQIDLKFLTDRQQTTEQICWQECWALFFELIEQPKLAEKYLNLLFPKVEIEGFNWKHLYRLANRQLLSAKVLMDSAVRLGLQTRCTLLKQVWEHYFSQYIPVSFFADNNKTLFTLLWQDKFAAKALFTEQAKATKPVMIVLSEPALSDLSPLRGLQLKILELKGDAGSVVDWSGLGPMSSVKSLTLRHCEIVDGTELLIFPNLKFLALQSTTVADWTTLAQLPSLTKLGLSLNKSKSIDGLQSVQELEEIEIFGSELNASQLKILAKLEKLKKFVLYSCVIDSLSPLATANRLNELYLFDTSISDMTSLQSLTQLTKLVVDNVEQNQISTISELSNLLSLTLCSEKTLKLTELTKLTNLTYLDIEAAKIKDISPLTALTNLTELRLPKGKIKGIELFDPKILQLPETSQPKKRQATKRNKSATENE
jgi:internalin A